MLRVIGTGSSGNCYALEDGGEILLLDAGLNIHNIMQGINYRASSVLGCLITHEHKDHCRAVIKLHNAGIPCIGSRGTAQVVEGVEYKPIKQEPDVWRFGHFLVMGFPTNHDAIDPYGYLITNTRTDERMIYATDTYYLRNTFPHINYWLIECNYIDSLITDETPAYLRGRLVESHMSLSRLCSVFRANDLASCRKIILCHMSKERGDETEMVGTIRQSTRKDVCMAHAGDVIPLLQRPF